MADEPIEIKIDNKAVNEKLLELAKRTENLRPLIAMIQDYLFELIKGEIPQQLIDELEELYLNSNFDKKERLAMLECIGDTHCYFYDEEEAQDDFEQELETDDNKY